MGVDCRRKDEVGKVQGREGAVIQDAPEVCPPPMRTRETKRLRRAVRASRIEALTRPTASSRAKARQKTPDTTVKAETGPKDAVKARSKKLKKTPDCTTTSKTPVVKVTVVQQDKTIVKADIRSATETPFLDAIAECDSDVYFFDKHDINPLLVDVGDALYDSVSEAPSSPMSCSTTLSSCIRLDKTERRERWSRFFGYSHNVACAVSFAAGLSLGMAIGACSLLRAPEVS